MSKSPKVIDYIRDSGSAFDYWQRTILSRIAAFVEQTVFEKTLGEYDREQVAAALATFEGFSLHFKECNKEDRDITSWISDRCILSGTDFVVPNAQYTTQLSLLGVFPSIEGFNAECNRIESVLGESVSKKTGSRLSLLVKTSHGIDFQNIACPNVSFCEQHYEQKVVSQFKAVCNRLVAHDNNGIALFNGPPGTGKTYLIRALLGLAKADYVIVQASALKDLTGPEMISALIDHVDDSARRPLVLIVEDADQAVGVRQKGKGATDEGLSVLLNLGDGLLGSALNTRIVCTTNLDVDQIDPAILRSGRLIQHIEIGKLSVERANQLLRTWGKDLTIVEDISLAELFKLKEA